MKHTVLLMLLTLLLAGGMCGYAAAEETLDNVTGPYADVEEQLSAVAWSLNSTAKAMIAGTPEESSADILTIAGRLDAAQIALSGSSLAASDVQDLIRIKYNLNTAGSDLLSEDADKASVLSTLQTAQTDLTAVKDHLASTLAWAEDDSDSFSSDIYVLKQGITDIENISASLENAAAFITVGTPDISVTIDLLETEITELIIIRDELISEAAPLTITDELATIISGLQNAANQLRNGADPNQISVEIVSASAAIESLNIQIATLPAPETTVPTGTSTDTPTETTTATQTSATQTIQPTVTVTAPTPEVIIPTETQTSEEGSNPGIIILIVVIICAAGVGAAVFIIKKRKSQRIKTDPLNIASKPVDQIPQTPRKEEEFVEIPAFQKEPIPTPEKTIPTPEPVRKPEPVVKPANPEKPVTLPSNAGPAEQFKLIASVIAKNRGILQKSEALAPRDLIDKDNPNPLLLEYIALYEKVRYSKRSTPEDTARLTELATRILKENA